MKLMTSLKVNISLQVLTIVLLFIVALLSGCTQIKALKDFERDWNRQVIEIKSPCQEVKVNKTNQTIHVYRTNKASTGREKVKVICL